MDILEGGKTLQSICAEGDPTGITEGLRSSACGPCGFISLLTCVTPAGACIITYLCFPVFTVVVRGSHLTGEGDGEIRHFDEIMLIDLRRDRRKDLT